MKIMNTKEIPNQEEVWDAVGEDWRKIYNYALDNNFRFLSYGDSSLLLK